MKDKHTIVVLDFDGFLVNSYALIRNTFASFNLDIGDEVRFKNRRKFLKYLGGGKEFLGNLVKYSLPKQKKIRAELTNQYSEYGKIYDEFLPLIKDIIAHPRFHVGILSRNFTSTPGLTIRKVFKNSGIDDHALDFVIPIPVGVKKIDILQAMLTPHFQHSIFAADEVGDYRAAVETGYQSILMTSYGFDTRERLIEKGNVPETMIADNPALAAKKLGKMIEAIKAKD